MGIGICGRLVALFLQYSGHIGGGYAYGEDMYIGGGAMASI